MLLFGIFFDFVAVDFVVDLLLAVGADLLDPYGLPKKESVFFFGASVSLAATRFLSAEAVDVLAKLGCFL